MAGKGLMLRKMYLEGRRLSVGFKRQIKAKRMISSLQRLGKRVLFVPKFCCKNYSKLVIFYEITKCCCRRWSSYPCQQSETLCWYLKKTHFRGWDTFGFSVTLNWYTLKMTCLEIMTAKFRLSYRSMWPELWCDAVIAVPLWESITLKVIFVFCLWLAYMRHSLLLYHKQSRVRTWWLRKPQIRDLTQRQRQ